jgi:hypothetical protein
MLRAKGRKDDSQMGAAPLAATSPPRLRRSLTTAIAGVLALLGASSATPVAAAVHWHADLTQAKAASQISHLPVLILFVASWSEKSVNHDKTFLASEEAVALLTACFEPVRIDCDADPATYKRLGVSHIPTACVVDADEPCGRRVPTRGNVRPTVAEVPWNSRRVRKLRHDAPSFGHAVPPPCPRNNTGDDGVVEAVDRGAQ